MTVTTEAKRQQLWVIADYCKQSDPMAAIKAIQGLNRMDGDYLAPLRRPMIALDIPAEFLR